MTTHIVWDVNHILLPIYGSIGVRWYSLMFLIGFLTGNYGFTKMAIAEGKPTKDIDTLLFYVVMGTIIGARLAHCLFYDPWHYLSNPLEILKVWEGGLASHGGYVGILAGMLLFSKKFPEMPFFWLADRCAIWAILTGSFIRIGNLFNSEIYGKVTDVPWAIIFAQVDQNPRHPTQIYESIGYLCLSGFMYWLYRHANRKPLEGRLLGVVFVFGYLWRIFIETFKENQEAFEDGMFLNMGQLLSIPFIILGIWLILGYQHKVKCLKGAFTEQKGTLS